MKRSLLSLLVCPECPSGAPLSVRASGSSEEISEGVLSCPQGHSFPITQGIPRFVRHDAYAGNFSMEWTIHKTTQLDSGARRESEQTFMERTGWTPRDLAGKRVLDAGCGMGRYMDVAQRWGAEVIGADLSFSVQSAQENLGAKKDVHVIQADLRKLPLARESLDAVYSIGVLHHTPDCKAAFLSLLPYLKKGGHISIWVYHAHMFGQGNHWRKLTTRMPRRLLYWLCFAGVPLYYVKKIPVVGLILHLIIPTSMHPDWRWRWLDTFDWYSPLYQSKHTYPEVVGWFRQAGLTDIQVFEPPVAVRGTKP